ncbi:MAG: hypothetical protein LBK04_01530 [Clostridiales Family XIII bacterium]|nr:hypothetical protein [Clostridiales Family XIII bacterium]
MVDNVAGGYNAFNIDAAALLGKEYNGDDVPGTGRLVGLFGSKDSSTFFNADGFICYLFPEGNAGNTNLDATYGDYDGNGVFFAIVTYKIDPPANMPREMEVNQVDMFAFDYGFSYNPDAGYEIYFLRLY